MCRRNAQVAAAAGRKDLVQVRQTADDVFISYFNIISFYRFSPLDIALVPFYILVFIILFLLDFHFHHMHNIVARAEAPYCIQRVISFEKVHIDRNCMFVCMVGMFLCVVRSGRWLVFKSLMR